MKKRTVLAVGFLQRHGTCNGQHIIEIDENNRFEGQEKIRLIAEEVEENND